MRHCVSIDERRAKFRQDLIYQGSQVKAKRQRHQHDRGDHKPHDDQEDDQRYKGRRATVVDQNTSAPTDDPRGRRQATLAPHESFFRPRSRSRSRITVNSGNRSRATSANGSEVSRLVVDDPESDDEQDVDEIW